MAHRVQRASVSADHVDGKYAAAQPGWRLRRWVEKANAVDGRLRASAVDDASDERIDVEVIHRSVTVNVIHTKELATAGRAAL